MSNTVILAVDQRTIVRFDYQADIQLQYACSVDYSPVAAAGKDPPGQALPLYAATENWNNLAMTCRRLAHRMGLPKSSVEQCKWRRLKRM